MIIYKRIKAWNKNRVLSDIGRLSDYDVWTLLYLKGRVRERGRGQLVHSPSRSNSWGSAMLKPGA